MKHIELPFEAVRNACIHSDGSILTIQINYGRHLIITVSGHGKGSEYYTSTRRNQDTMGSGECMNARNIGASLSIESIPDRGITVTLRASGRLAYKDSSVIRAFRKMKDSVVQP
jgi:hypothetical protein